jgi:hypothetical protein
MPTETAASNVGTVTAILSMALQVLTSRVVILLAMGMSFGLFCWAMWAQSIISLATAATFTVLVFLPVFLRSQSHARQDG